MKYMLSIIVLGIVSFGLTLDAHAQKFGLGAGVGYGSEYETASLNVGVLYSFTDEIRSSLDVAYFLPKNDLTWININVDGHYGFIENEKMFVYGLVGVNYIILNIKGVGTGVSNSNETGFNVGAGMDYRLGTIGVFGEAKYVINKIMLNNQITGTVGARFFF